MNRIATARTRLEHAADLPDVLDTSYDAFEDILAVLRHHQDRAAGAFPAFVLAASAASNGRDRIAEAPSLPPATEARSPTAADHLMDSIDGVDVALEIAEAPFPPAATIAPFAAVASDLMDAHSWVHVALEIADISDRLAARLTNAAATAAEPADRTSCERAASHATRINALLVGARQP